MLKKTEAGERVERALEPRCGWRSEADVEVRILAEKMLAAGIDEELATYLIGGLIVAVADHCGTLLTPAYRRAARSSGGEAGR